MSDYTTLHATTKNLLEDASDALASFKALNDAAMDAGKRRYGLSRMPQDLKEGLRREYRKIEDTYERLRPLNDDFIALCVVADRVRANGGSPRTPMSRPIPGGGYAALSLAECQRRLQRKVREVMSAGGS